MQIYDQIYQENFERARKEEEERAREAAMKEQQAAWGGPPGLQNPGWGANPAGNGWQGVRPLEQDISAAHDARVSHENLCDRVTDAAGPLALGAHRRMSVS